MKKIMIAIGLCLLLFDCNRIGHKKQDVQNEIVKSFMDSLYRVTQNLEKNEGIKLNYNLDSAFYVIKEVIKDSFKVQLKMIEIKGEFSQRTDQVEFNKNVKKIEAAINDLQNMKSFIYEGSVEDILNEYKLFQDYWVLYSSVETSQDKKMQKQVKTFENALKSCQTKEFPKMRANYGKIAKNKLWEENIQVKVFGKGNNTISLVGGTFASNKNIKDTQETLSDIFYKLRYKRAEYKWIPSEDEYTYYTIFEGKDSDRI